MNLSVRKLRDRCRVLTIISLIYSVCYATESTYTGQQTDTSMVWDERVTELLKSKQPDDIVLTALGDLIWTREITHFPEPEYRNLYRLLQEAEITYGNLEMSLNERPELQRGLYNYRKGRDFAWEISRIGVNLVSVANNHALDFGTEGFEETLSILDRSGISYAGGALSPQEARRPSQQQFGKTKFSLLSFYSSSSAESDDSGPTIATINAPEVLLEEADGEVGVAVAPLESDVLEMEDAIRLAKARSDIVMVHFHLHWVSHSRAYPIPDSVPPHQHPVMRRAIDAGADIVLGNGPHVLRGIEIYRNKPIFYSLGNFIYQYRTAEIPAIIWKRDQQQDIQEEFQTVVPRLTVRDKKIVRIELIPCDLEMSGPRTGSPRLAADDRGRTIIGLLQRLSEPYGTRIRQKSWYATVEL